MNTSSVLAVVLRVVDTLERLSIDYHLGGSFASTIHGIPRQTADVDVVVDLDTTSGERLVEALGAEFYIDQHAVDDAISRRSSFNAIHLATGFKVDFFVMGRQQFDRVELQRSIREQIVADPPTWAPVKSAEDVILRKLQWYEEGGRVSDRQWTDVLGVLKTQGDRLDTAYLTEWARRLGLSDLLTRACSEASTTD
ncbi:MAG TPA: hypothetical protein VLT32_21695 [Candidatus Sulfomarinibacteraceae bacterium]|nr:hypothetical protein [Candidatus Sulfomarinibacteraceae bacterium]